MCIAMCLCVGLVRIRKCIRFATGKLYFMIIYLGHDYKYYNFIEHATIVVSAVFMYQSQSHTVIISFELIISRFNGKLNTGYLIQGCVVGVISRRAFFITLFVCIGCVYKDTTG